MIFLKPSSVLLLILAVLEPTSSTRQDDSTPTSTDDSSSKERILDKDAPLLHRNIQSDPSDNTAPPLFNMVDVESSPCLFHENHRSLFDVKSFEDFPCNEVMQILPVDIIKNVSQEVFSFYAQDFNLTEAAAIVGNTIPMLEYDVQMMKVCGSCMSENLSGYGCEENDYGYNTTHSGLLLLPVKFNYISVSMIDAKELQTWFNFRISAVSQSDSIRLTDDIGGGNVEFSMIAASMGLTAIIPEKMGFGESRGLVPSTLNKKGTITSLLPLMEKARSIVQFMSDGKTSLGNEAYYLGASEGGYTSVAAADGLLKHGVVPKKVLAYAAPLKIRSWATLPLINFNSNNFDTFLTILLAVMALSLSDTRPDAANYGFDQPLIKAEFSPFLKQMFQDENLPSPVKDPDGFSTYIMEQHPTIAVALYTKASFFNQDLIDFISAAFSKLDFDPCMNDPQSAMNFGVNKICEALDENDLTDVVLNATYDIEFSHSVDDMLVHINNIPDMSLLKYPFEGVAHNDGVILGLVKLFEGITLEKPAMRSCSDSPLRVFLDGKGAPEKSRTCKDIGRKFSTFCDIKGIQTHCPETCGKCSDYESSDSLATFYFRKGKRDCDFVRGGHNNKGLARASRLCQKDNIKNTCRKLCSFFSQGKCEE